MLQRWPLFAEGSWLTVRLAFVATLSGFAIGTLCAAGRRSSHRLLARAETVWR